MNRVILFVMLLLATPAFAQLTYPGAGKSADASGKNTNKFDVIVKKTRATEKAVRPDWYGLFLLWAKSHPGDILAGLRDPATFENFSAFMACDWIRDYRSNEIIWPQKQLQIVQKFNERVLNPQSQFRLLTYAVLGSYVLEQQQFVFRPLDGSAFSIQFPPDKAFGMEDDCNGQTKSSPQIPWPREFVIGFTNQDFIKTLPMEKIKAQYFIDNLPKNEKGEVDRRLVVEVEFEVTNFYPTSTADVLPTDRGVPPVHVGVAARRAIVYANAERTKELARFGF